MKVDILTNDIKLSQEAQKIIDRSVDKLAKRLKRYHPDASHLTIRFSKDGKNDYLCTLELKVLHKTLVGKKEHPDLTNAFREAYNALIKEFEKYRLKINKSLRSRKKAKIEIEAPEEQVRDWRMIFQEAVERKLEALHRLARHLLLHHQLTGMLEPGEILPDDIVEETIIRVYQKFPEVTDSKDVEIELMREIFPVAEELVKETLRTRVDTISIEEPASAIPEEEEVTTLGEEILYFYEPDEALQVEDIIEDPSAITPEQVVESEELQKLLYSLLSKLPDDQREVFTLVNIEGVNVEEASMALKKSPDEISDLLAKAEEELAKQLSRGETPVTRERVRDVYRTIFTLPMEISVEAKLRRVVRVIEKI